MPADPSASSTQPLRVVLYSSPISDCSARLRLALLLKGVPFELSTVHIRAGDNQTSSYAEINPAKTVPTLLVYPQAIDGQNQPPIALTQSLASLEYIEEVFPLPSLLPPVSDPVGRAKVRTLVNIITVDIHPLTTHRVGYEVASRSSGSAQQPDRTKAHADRSWNIHWISKGIESYERTVAATAGKYSYGDQVTMADVVLVPELWTASRIGIDLRQFPVVHRIFEGLSMLEAVRTAKQDPSPEL